PRAMASSIRTPTLIPSLTCVYSQPPEYRAGARLRIATGAGQVEKGKKRVNPASYPTDGQAFSFGPFRLLAAQRLLLEGDQPVRLGSRAFDILATLLERPGEVIGKDDLKSRT